MSAPHGLRLPNTGEVPARGTREYAWWIEGCQAEADARKKGRSKDGLEVRDFVDALAENRPEMTGPEIAAMVYDIFTLCQMPRRRRLRAALKVLRGQL